MRVLHVIPSISPRRGGPSEVVLRMVEAQRAFGLDSEIATSDEDLDRGDFYPGQLVLHGGIPVRFFPRRLTSLSVLREYAFCPSFPSWLRPQLATYDLLHVHAIFSHLPTTAMRLARGAGVPYISRPLGQLGRWPLRQGALKKAAYLRLVEAGNLRSASAIHFASASEQEEAADLSLNPRGSVIPHGIKLPPLLPHAADTLRRKLGLAPERKIVLFLGRLHGKKGIDLLLRALSLLPAPRPVLLVAGDGPEREPLQELARELGVADDVRWLGHVEGQRKQLCLQGADLFALTSHHENFGMAVVEALAVGTPVLVSPQVALASTIAQHGLGRVAPLEPPAIARGIALELNSRSPEQDAARRRFVGQTYSWAANAKALAGLYAEVTKDRAGRSGTGAVKQPSPDEAACHLRAGPGRAPGQPHRL